MNPSHEMSGTPEIVKPVPMTGNPQPSVSADSVLLLNSNSIQCKLPAQHTRGDVEIGFPRVSNRAPSAGVIRAAMIFVDFNDSPATISPGDVYSYFDSASALFNQMSYDKVTLQITPDLQWHRMSGTSASYGQSIRSGFAGLRSYMSEAVTLASHSADFSNVDVVYVVSNPTARSITGSFAFLPPSGSEITIGKSRISNGAVLGANNIGIYAKTLVHETSHTMGLVDDYNAYYSASNPSDAFRFTGDFGIMSTLYGTAPEYFAWESWLMGWLDDSQINCLAPGNQTLTLNALETQGGVKMAEIPLSATKALIIESRRPILADSNLSNSGVLIYTVDTSIASARGPIRIIGGTASNHLTDALLSEGNQVTIGNVKIVVTSSTTTSDTINVQVG
ncbi:MAG TPA: hypothetical protein VMV52_03325 [Candidatus Nanopelagicaceae bacterium]|nr:hypothetical protein [Candidatus Nanopelagicaceae bacterium]